MKSRQKTLSRCRNEISTTFLGKCYTKFRINDIFLRNHSIIICIADNPNIVYEQRGIGRDLLFFFFFLLKENKYESSDSSSSFVRN